MFRGFFPSFFFVYGRDDMDRGGVELYGGDERAAATAYLVWEDLTVMLPNSGHESTKKLLNGLSGCAEYTPPLFILIYIYIYIYFY
ncbi:ABC transporter G family member 13 [Camellia lanceoleosa]|uniref:ABC transporter G family member 13 n=1 Tax=Camellia lanceoleosa TaxID=1840588 RepID=A0ACC0J449_9ERIC|nr:ABC transporter G family member 13 [Camellia lanceoleosa]